MKVLLDECLPKKLKYELEADEATTVPEAGWASKTNGELLSLAETDFDVFLTRDQNLEYQQNLKRFDVESAKRMTGNSPAVQSLCQNRER